MATYRLSGRAKRDLLEIARYTQREWGEAQAKTYVEELERFCMKLAADWSIGRRVTGSLPGTMRMEHMSHVAFYRVEDGGIYVVRILHKRMLPRRQGL